MTFNPNDAHVGDTGTVLQKTVVDGGVPFDLSAATTLELVVVDPDGTGEVLTGSLETDGTDGIVNFTTTATTWRTAGYDCEQVQIVNPDGAWSSEIVKRRILPKLA